MASLREQALNVLEWPVDDKYIIVCAGKMIKEADAQKLVSEFPNVKDGAVMVVTKTKGKAEPAASPAAAAAPAAAVEPAAVIVSAAPAPVAAPAAQVSDAMTDDINISAGK